MPVLPWTINESTTAGSEVVVLASSLRLRSVRHVPGFLRHALRIRRQVLRSPGAIGVSLIAQPSRKTFWTLSAWTDEAAINAFVGAEPHRSTMGRYHDRLAGAQFTTWSTAATASPAARSNAKELWKEGRRRLATAGVA